MSWLDLLFVLLLAATTALGAERRWSGLAIGLGAVLLYRPLLLLAAWNPFVALLLALAAGLALSLLGRRLAPLGRTRLSLQRWLGGLGGALLGVLVVLALVTALPIRRNAAGQILYPPADLPPALASATTHSRLVRLGRDILLYPLLLGDGYFDHVGALERNATQGLHHFLVVGRPWEGR